MIRGIGVDIIEIARIRKDIEESGDHFLNKVFTAPEIAYCRARQNQHQHFAARFAAKEAVSKALATGWSGAFRWKDVEVTNDASGRPGVTIAGRLRELTAGTTIHVSLSHSTEHVVAMAIVEELTS